MMRSLACCMLPAALLVMALLPSGDSFRLPGRLSQPSPHLYLNKATTRLYASPSAAATQPNRAPGPGPMRRLEAAFAASLQSLASTRLFIAITAAYASAAATLKRALTGLVIIASLLMPKPAHLLSWQTGNVATISTTVTKATTSLSSTAAALFKAEQLPSVVTRVANAQLASQPRKLASEIATAIAKTTGIASAAALFANPAPAAAVSNPFAAAARTLGKRYVNLRPEQRLATTPVFVVTNSGGQPYLQEDVQAGRPQQRIIVYFMSSEDASDYLSEMAQGNPASVNEFRLKAVSLEKVINQIRSHKQSRKLGRFNTNTIYRIQPSARQVENAARVGGRAAQQDIAIPMFSATGLTMQRPGGETLTPYYFAYEDLVDDWSRLVSEAAAEGRKLPSLSGSSNSKSVSASVSVTDMSEVLLLAQGIDKERVRPLSEAASQAAAAKDKDSVSVSVSVSVGGRVGVVPPRREIEMVKAFYRNKAGFKGEFQQARIIGPPR